jgi:5'-AMP-activated protein kinase regulatory beta subunit
MRIKEIIKKERKKERNNVVTFFCFSCIVSSSPVDTYYDVASLDQFPLSHSPPLCPPHLLQALLNAPGEDDPTLLPLPNHVVLNHYYSLRRKDMTIVGVTSRYKQKFVTTVLYKPESEHATAQVAK